MVFISLFYLCEVVTCLDIGLLPIGILAVKKKLIKLIRHYCLIVNVYGIYSLKFNAF